jgi:hypothetical protein
MNGKRIVLSRGGGELDWLSLVRWGYRKRSGYKIGHLGSFIAIGGAIFAGDLEGTFGYFWTWRGDFCWLTRLRNIAIKGVIRYCCERGLCCVGRGCKRVANGWCFASKGKRVYGSILLRWGQTVKNSTVYVHRFAFGVN